MKFLYEIEKDQESNEYVASCDELRAVASGRTEHEAIDNLTCAVKELLKEFGPELTGTQKKRVVVEVM